MQVDGSGSGELKASEQYLKEGVREDARDANVHCPRMTSDRKKLFVQRGFQKHNSSIIFAPANRYRTEWVLKGVNNLIEDSQLD